MIVLRVCKSKKEQKNTHTHTKCCRCDFPSTKNHVVRVNLGGRQERILSFDPDMLRLNWISTGIRRKPGSMLAKVRV